jgi:long-chain acyl-CoA synthetase
MREPRTLADFFHVWSTSTPAPVLIDARHGAADTLVAPEVVARVAGLALGLKDLGIQPGDRVALLCGNRPEWHIIDMALQHLRGVNVSVYTTLLPDQVAYILKDCGAKAIIVDCPEQLAKVAEIRAGLPDLAHVALIDGDGGDGVVPFTSLVKSLETAEAGRVLGEMRDAVAPDDLATLIYTSGTTGRPKGAMLSQDSLVCNASNSSSVMPWPEGGEVALSFLPLSHVLERLVDYIYFLKGISIAYCEVPELADALRRVRPHLFTAVPRVYEKIREKIYDEVSHAPALKRALFHRAIAVARASYRSGHKGSAYHLFDALVYKKLRAALGGRVRFSISGGAPLSARVGEFFQSIGVRVLEGYGLTETSPVITVNPFDAPKLGTVGRPIPGVEVKIAADGEVLTRGRHVMKGYWHDPEATASAIDRDGWLATGDIGEMGDDGYLRITDRKKDLIVTAGAKNVAPQPIENSLTASPLIENAVLFGDRMPYIVALIVPAFDALAQWAEGQRIVVRDRRTLLEEARVVAEYQRIIDEVNASLARFETVKKFRFVTEPFVIGTELTPTLKVKRRVVAERYRLALDEMYGEEEQAGADRE